MNINLSTSDYIAVAAVTISLLAVLTSLRSCKQADRSIAQADRSLVQADQSLLQAGKTLANSEEALSLAKEQHQASQVLLWTGTIQGSGDENSPRLLLQPSNPDIRITTLELNYSEVLTRESARRVVTLKDISIELGEITEMLHHYYHYRYMDANGFSNHRKTPDGPLPTSLPIGLTCEYIVNGTILKSRSVYYLEISWNKGNPYSFALDQSPYPPIDLIGINLAYHLGHDVSMSDILARENLELSYVLDTFYSRGAAPWPVEDGGSEAEIEH